jgi:hypothetical protein
MVHAMHVVDGLIEQDLKFPKVEEDAEALVTPIHGEGCLRLKLHGTEWLIAIGANPVRLRPAGDLIADGAEVDIVEPVAVGAHPGLDW